MKKSKKIWTIIVLCFFLPPIILSILGILKGLSYLEPVPTWIKYTFLVTIYLIVPLILYVAVKRSKMLPLPLSIFVYYCWTIIFLSFQGYILMTIPINMTGIGLSLLALAWTLFKPGEKQQNAGAIEKLEALDTLSDKMRKAEKTLDVFLEESQKLAKRLNALQKEEKNKNKKDD